jgi:aminoglycoside phosphotransferase (APT) family kinase protein
MSTLMGLPAERREPALCALTEAFGGVPAGPLQPVFGGASGALAYKVRAEGRDYLLRLADPQAEAVRNPHHYACIRAAAAAGIAPPIRYVDPSQGVVIMDFIEQRPLAEFPGGPASLVRAIGELLARLQELPGFPSHFSFPDLIGRSLAFLATSGRIAPGLLERHARLFDVIRSAYPWDSDRRVASHNDPNARNLLFDGERLWLIDWETACLNEPTVDVAIVTHELATTPSLEDALLTSWLGRPPDRDVRARLALMKPLTKLYYAALLFTLSPPPQIPDDDLAAPSIDAFKAAVASGELRVGSPEMLRSLGKIVLAGFLADAASRDFAEALAWLG